MNKNIGLIIATETEFKEIFSHGDCKTITLETFPYRIEKVIINNKEIIAINSGVGEIYAAAAAQYLISNYKVNFLLNYGVVGSLVDSLSLKSTVFIDQVFDYEFDTSAIDHCPLGYRDEYKDIYIPVLTKELKAFLDKKFPSIPTVTCASGNKFIADANFKAKLQNTYKCSICEMEASGLALIANKNNVPMLFVKGVSDTKNGSENEFYKMIEESSNVAFKLLVELINEL